jgi:putative transport protein
VLRNLGLTLFLAQVGMSSAPKFAAAVTESGLQMLGLGAIVLVALVLPILLIGLLVYRMPYDEVAGIVAGVCGNPAILAYSNKLAPTERPDIRLGDNLPGHDHREDPVCGYHPGAVCEIETEGRRFGQSCRPG